MHGITDVSYVALNHSFRAVRAFNESLQPVNFELKLYCGPNRSTGQSVEEAGHLSAVNYRVLMFWIEHILDDVVFLDPNTELGEVLYYAVNNKIIHTPGSPDDFLITRLLHSKFRSIVGDHLQLGAMVLSSSDTDYTERYWQGDEYILPPRVFPEDVSVVHDTPWWLRPTIDTLEIQTEDVTPEEAQEILDIKDPLTDLREQLMEEYSDQEAEIIDDLWNQ